MSIKEAYELAPHAVCLPGRHGVYSEHSQRVRELAQGYTPVSQVASIDELFLDFSGCEELYKRPGDRDPDGTIGRVMRALTDEIQAKIGLPASAGIATSRSVVKVASGLAKPHGVLLVPAGTESDFLDPLPVRRFPGIGPVGEKRLHALGLRTLAEVARAPFADLRRIFGAWAEPIQRGCRGQGMHELGRERPAFQEHDPEGCAIGTISNERTFSEDLRDPLCIDAMLCSLCERVCWRARKRGMKARTVTLELRYTNFHAPRNSAPIKPLSSLRASVWPAACSCAPASGIPGSLSTRTTIRQLGRTRGPQRPTTPGIPTAEVCSWRTPRQQACAATRLRPRIRPHSPPQPTKECARCAATSRLCSTSTRPRPTPKSGQRPSSSCAS